jgi:hypothetical protein
MDGDGRLEAYFNVHCRRPALAQHVAPRHHAGTRTWQLSRRATTAPACGYLAAVAVALRAPDPVGQHLALALDLDRTPLLDDHVLAGCGNHMTCDWFATISPSALSLSTHPIQDRGRARDPRRALCPHKSPVHSFRAAPLSSTHTIPARRHSPTAPPPATVRQPSSQRPGTDSPGACTHGGRAACVWRVCSGSGLGDCGGVVC